MLRPAPRFRRGRFAECPLGHIPDHRIPGRACPAAPLGGTGLVAHASLGARRRPHSLVLCILDHHARGRRVYFLLRTEPAGFRRAVASQAMVSAHLSVSATRGVLSSCVRLFLTAIAGLCVGCRAAAALDFLDSVILVRWPVPAVERIAASGAGPICAARMGWFSLSNLRERRLLCGFVPSHSAQDRGGTRYRRRLPECSGCRASEAHSKARSRNSAFEVCSAAASIA